MPRSVPEWIGKTPDSKPPRRVKIRVFDRYNGTCHLSGRKINPGDKWECHHITGLIEGGENRESNLAPALIEPHKAETKRQMAEKKAINRKKAKHLGLNGTKVKIKNRGFYKVEKEPITPYEPMPPKRLYG